MSSHSATRSCGRACRRASRSGRGRRCGSASPRTPARSWTGEAPMPLSDLRRYRRFAVDLWRYVGREFPREECRRIVAEELRDREPSFLRLLDQAVYRRPQSPYHALLAHAGVEHGDIATLVAAGGIEHALDRLYAAGVF